MAQESGADQIDIVTALCGVVAGVLVLVGGIALGRTFASATGGTIGMFGAGTGVVIIVASLLAALGLMAAGEWIDLHVNMEENTRPVDAVVELDAELRWITWTARFRATITSIAPHTPCPMSVARPSNRAAGAASTSLMLPRPYSLTAQRS